MLFWVKNHLILVGIDYFRPQTEAFQIGIFVTHALPLHPLRVHSQAADIARQQQKAAAKRRTQPSSSTTTMGVGAS